MGDYAEVNPPSGVQAADLSNTTPTIAFEIDENGHASGIHVTKGSGNADMDAACIDAIRRTRFQPAIQDHLKLRSSENHEFNVAGG